MTIASVVNVELSSAICTSFLPSDATMRNGLELLTAQYSAFG